jgi:hypothetical protein
VGGKCPKYEGEAKFFTYRPANNTKTKQEHKDCEFPWGLGIEVEERSLGIQFQKKRRRRLLRSFN